MSRPFNKSLDCVLDVVWLVRLNLTPISRSTVHSSISLYGFFHTNIHMHKLVVTQTLTYMYIMLDPLRLFWGPRMLVPEI